MDEGHGHEWTRWKRWTLRLMDEWTGPKDKVTGRTRPFLSIMSIESIRVHVHLKSSTKNKKSGDSSTKIKLTHGIAKALHFNF